MDIEYKGGNCVVLTTKKTTIAVDPKLAGLGLRDQGEKADVELLTQPQFAAPHGEEAVIIDGPGEYEVENVSIKGVSALAHLDPKGAPLKATMYRVETSEFSIVIVGHIHPELTEEQLESLGVADILIVPVGGNGYTLDATGAVQLVRAVDPKLVIPTHYADSAVKFEVPQAELGDFLKELGATPQEEVAKLKLKPGVLGETLAVQPLKRTS